MFFFFFHQIPCPPLSIWVRPDGSTRISSDILVAKGRGGEEVDVAVITKNPDKRPVVVVQGEAQGVEVKGLEPGAEYWVEMTPVQGRPFNYTGSFKACESQ
ncbi:fibronectin type-III domain-containing protein [Caerostris extrusa]|uniref:Fibronectin type-III domain-containing protein n=1 Tax=Caerostris extrusa TaxID=172846 RepID=A0AAV4MLC5_CAEEX|nr:fibronectin type-III domain-containing protein [Caerostris extrusa]